MGKKRNIQPTPVTPSCVKVEIKDEIGDSEVLVARDRLKGALQELLQNSDTSSSAESSEENFIHDYRHRIRKMSKALNIQQTRKISRCRQVQIDTPFHHTYVMKLFDRSVDLAQFQEDTPLYPICRAWMANQPRNPNLIPKVRSPSPEIVTEISKCTNILDASEKIPDFYYLPSPLPCKEANLCVSHPTMCSVREELKLHYDGQSLKSREVLLREHRIHWNAVRKKLHQQANKKELRYARSQNILSVIFKRAQSEFEQ